MANSLATLSPEGRIASQNPLGFFYLQSLIFDLNLGYTEISNELMVRGVDAINGMIENLLFTVIGTRIFEPEFGSRLPFLIWEPCDDFTAYLIETEFYNVIPRWIPYITLDKKDSSVKPFTSGDGFTAIIVYFWVPANITGTLILPIQSGGTS